MCLIFRLGFKRKGVLLTDQRERVERFTEELREGPTVSDRSIKEILDALRPQLQELVNKQIELAKAELIPVGKRVGIAVGLVVSGAVFMFLLLIFLLLTVMFGIWEGLPLWAAALIVSGILLVIGGGLAAAGAMIVMRLDPKPHRTITTLQQNINWLKGQLKP